VAKSTPGRHVSITDVARRAGVSVTTVSHVLSGRRPVSEHTRQRVQRIITETGYQANQVARSLRMQRSYTIGLIIPDITNPFYPSLASGMQEVLRTGGYDVIICNTNADPEVERAVLTRMVTRRVDGVAFAGYYNHVREVGPAVKVGIPVVLLGTQVPGPGIDVLSTDDLAAGQIASRYLIERGYRRIGFITGPAGAGPAAERVAGYRRALSEAGIRFDKTLIAREEFSRVGGASGIARLLDLARPPQAVLCTNDVVAIGALDTVRGRGLRVPDDVAVMGFDDIDAAALISPALTTVSVIPVQQGRALGELLLRRIEGPQPEEPQRILFEPFVVARETA
jgi:LacI family transcriptional regulator